MRVDQLRDVVAYDEVSEVDEGMWDRLKRLVHEKREARRDIVIVSFPWRRESLFERSSDA